MDTYFEWSKLKRFPCIEYEGKDNTLLLESPSNLAQEISEIEKKQLIIDLGNILQKEVSETELISTLGTLGITLSDNIFYFALNLNAAETITSLFNITGVFKSIIHYTMLVNGMFTTTAMDLGSVI
ncbi:MAG: hypothetical protein H0U73_01925 [Tatlockia sp.]|nr:hypothetical protein [Tatlockia sp.]